MEEVDLFVKEYQYFKAVLKMCEKQTQDLAQGVETITTCEHPSPECTGYHPRPGALFHLHQAEHRLLTGVPPW